MLVLLSADTIALVKSTIPALEKHGLIIAQRMYERLFQNAEIRNHFNQSHHRAGSGSQAQALAGALVAYARNIDNLTALTGAIERITQKHVALNILREHYRHVAIELLGAIHDVLGEAATPRICAAWNEAYWFLAETLIARESAVYSDRASRPGGWRGWRDFVVESVTLESLVIRSFVLVPKDGNPVLPHRPGQYLGLLAEIPDHGSVKRNYSISCGPNARSYRITVKREAPEGLPAGVVSTWLHDRIGADTVLKIAPPAGDFFLDLDHSAPVVLVSGGVGLTPLMSMLEAIVASTPQRSTWYVHGALNGHVHAMGARVRALAQQAPGVLLRTFYEKPHSGDRLGHTHDEVGMINTEWLARHTPLREGLYFLCGPKPFLRALVGGLLGCGVLAERVRYEFFGPTDEILAAATAAA